ncbi:MAG: hypothetical protein V3W18_00165 [candidate division Zixibacteria bacterium]
MVSTVYCRTDVPFDLRPTSGVYFARLEVGGGSSETVKIVLLK